MDDAKQQLTETLKSANNILVTVSRDPSVDQLSALLGLTLVLNKQGKHAAAVFSGHVPSTLEFLQPEETIEKNTDSLRDFIIALDKTKADKLRYKVEDNVVRIFITPYKTSITQEDFDFSQGDFNVDAVVAIGVKQQEDLDEAITAHGRILHDATLTSLNVSSEGGLGTINWHAPKASSLSELVTDLVQGLGPDLLDEQIATALLTGIVAETDRFRNDKTSAQTMTMSATLMAAGANQQLVASKLEEPERENQSEGNDNDGSSAGDDEEKPNDGMIEINHGEGDAESGESSESMELPSPDASEPEGETSEESNSNLSAGGTLITEPPTMGGVLTANSSQEQYEPGVNPLNLPSSEQPALIEHDSESLPVPDEPEPDTAPPADLTPPPPAWTPPAAPPEPAAVPEPPVLPATPPPEPSASDDNDQTDQPQTLAELEASAQSQTPEPPAGLDAARDEVNRALTDAIDPSTPSAEPIQALNAQPLGVDLHPADPAPSAAPSLEDQIPGFSPIPDPAAAPLPDPVVPPVPGQMVDPNAPPPVPPPIPFQFGNSSPQQ